MSETNQARDKPEEVQQISLSQIHPFPEHPFQVRDDELMQQTIDSIQQVGISNFHLYEVIGVEVLSSSLSSYSLNGAHPNFRIKILSQEFTL